MALWSFSCEGASFKIQHSTWSLTSSRGARAGGMWSASEGGRRGPYTGHAGQRSPPVKLLGALGWRPAIYFLNLILSAPDVKVSTRWHKWLTDKPEGDKEDLLGDHCSPTCKEHRRGGGWGARGDQLPSQTPRATQDPPHLMPSPWQPTVSGTPVVSGPCGYCTPPWPHGWPVPRVQPRAILKAGKETLRGTRFSSLKATLSSTRD